MGRYNSNRITTKFVQNYMKERLWEKNNSEYVPFLNVRSVPTKGKSSRVMGWKTGREHHFLSKLECAAFYHFDWSDNVIDIKEQYPLLPMELLQNIAEEAGIEYPNFNGEPIIMTTDFFITVKRNENIVNYARTIKPSTDLSKKRVLEKFEIERRFFASKNVDWGIITEKDLSEVFWSNMDILHSNKLIKDETDIPNQYLFTVYNHLAENVEVSAYKDMPLAYMLSQLSINLSVTLSYITEAFFKAIVDKIITLDIYNKPLNINTLKLKDIEVNSDLLLKTTNTL